MVWVKARGVQVMVLTYQNLFTYFNINRYPSPSPTGTRASYHLNRLINLDPHITNTLYARYNSPPPISSPCARYLAFGDENPRPH
jgi:hypothetical protein